MNAEALTLWGEFVAEAPYPMSREEFNLWHGHGWRYELVAGRLIRTPRSGGGHSRLAITLTVAFVTQCGHLGYGLGADTSFMLTIPEEEQPLCLFPDVCFVRKDQAPDHDDIAAWFAPWRVIPDIVVEIVSSFEKAKGVNEKARLWLAAGVKRCWVIWPARRKVEIWRPGGAAPTIEERGIADSISGEDIVPFVLSVRELF